MSSPLVDPEPKTPLALSCAGAATIQSAYFVVTCSRSNTLSGDTPIIDVGLISSGSGGISVVGGADNWFIGSQPNPTHGIWTPTTTYNVGDTVASSLYTIKDGSTYLYPITYKSQYGPNVNHLPEDCDGYWACITSPPRVGTDFDAVTFTYLCSGLPTLTTLANTSWGSSGFGGIFWNSLFWSAPGGPPGNIWQIMDVYFRFNYLVGSKITPTFSRPTAWTGDPGSLTGYSGLVVHPGINMQLQCWHTSGLANFPSVQLTNFDPTPLINGVQPQGTVGTPYLSVLVATGGTPPYVFAIIAGGLPPGVNLDPATGVISGNPGSSGIFNFTASVTDSTGATAQTTCATPLNCGGGAAQGNAFY